MFIQNRRIIHINAAHFAVAMEQAEDPSLKRRPVVVAPAGIARALVFDMSNEAFKEGVRKGMLLSRAHHRCPGAIVLPPNHGLYALGMRELLKQALTITPLVEKGKGEGHLFMDVTCSSSLFGPARDMAWRLHRAIKTELSRLDPFDPENVAPAKAFLRDTRQYQRAYAPFSQAVKNS